MADAENDVEEKPVAAAPADTATVDLRQPAGSSAVTSAPLPAPTSPPVDSMLVTPEQQKALQDRLVAIKKAQMASSNAGASETVGRLRADRADMEERYKATALPGEDLQPWDTKGKQAEHTTDPIVAFGSIGSVFAMIAPMFARLPMEASLNAGAAALDAIHAGDDKAYDRDFASWKENTNLALKRHDIMRQAYNDSILKMNTDLNAGRSEMELNARKFGDQQALTLLEAGLDGDLNKAINDRNKTALELQSTADKVWLEHEKVQDLRNDPNYQSGNPELKMKAIQDHNERWQAGGRSRLAYDAEADFVKKYKDENPEWTSQSLQEAIAGFRKSTDEKGGAAASNAAGMQAEEIRRRTTQYMKPAEEGGAGLDPSAAFDRATREVKIAASAREPKSDNGKLTGPQMKERERLQYAEKVKADHPDWSATQVLEESRRLQEVGNPPPLTSAQYGKTQDRAFMANETLGTLDKQLSRLESNYYLTGTAGKVRQGAEKIGNILGSDQVVAQEFAKDIELLRTNAGRMLTMSQGRPLASEANRINSIIKGNSFGDLTKPTIEALRDYRNFIQRFKEDSTTRLQGNPTQSQQPESTPAPPARGSAPGNSKKPWERDPIISPRSELDSQAVAG